MMYMAIRKQVVTCIKRSTIQGFAVRSSVVPLAFKMSSKDRYFPVAPWQPCHWYKRRQNNALKKIILQGT